MRHGRRDATTGDRSGQDRGPCVAERRMGRLKRRKRMHGDLAGLAMAVAGAATGIGERRQSCSLHAATPARHARVREERTPALPHAASRVGLIQRGTKFTLLRVCRGSPSLPPSIRVLLVVVSPPSLPPSPFSSPPLNRLPRSPPAQAPRVRCCPSRLPSVHAPLPLVSPISYITYGTTLSQNTFISPGDKASSSHRPLTRPPSKYISSST